MKKRLSVSREEEDEEDEDEEQRERIDDEFEEAGGDDDNGGSITLERFMEWFSATCRTRTTAERYLLSSGYSFKVFLNLSDAHAAE